MRLVEPNLFSKYIHQPTVFANKSLLSPHHVPAKIAHREVEIGQLTAALAPILRGYGSANVFIYGNCGTGKTICSRFVASQLVTASKKPVVRVVYINCKLKKVADTEYRLLTQILREFGETVPDTGLPTDVLYRRFVAAVDERQQTIVLILDEIDALVRKVGDEFLYNFVRLNTELQKARITILGITNDLAFRDNLDQRIKSSLGEEEVLFKPYTASQLKDILDERASEAFNTGAVEPAAINKCAALAAQEHGDARRALDLLRVAGEIADRNGEETVSEQHTDVAERRLDTDRVIETIKAQPKQTQTILFAAITSAEARPATDRWADKRLLTGDLYASYCTLCQRNNLKVLTPRRFSDLIGELDTLGIVATRIISKGRYGRMREIMLSVNGELLEKVKDYLALRLN